MKVIRAVLALMLLLSQVIALAVARADTTVSKPAATVAPTESDPTVEPTQSLAPTAEPTAAVADTTQSTAAVVLIWAAIIIVVAITVFLVFLKAV
jgi:hypothetical protein